MGAVIKYKNATQYSYTDICFWYIKTPATAVTSVGTYIELCGVCDIIRKKSGFQNDVKLCCGFVK